MSLTKETELRVNCTFQILLKITNNVKIYSYMFERINTKHQTYKENVIFMLYVYKAIIFLISF